MQQSVLGDDHKDVEDTLSNIDFSNAFHSWVVQQVPSNVQRSWDVYHQLNVFGTFNNNT